MRAKVLARYTEITLGPFEVAWIACALCGERLGLHSRLVLIPANAREVGWMCKGRHYVGVPAHRACLEEMP